MAPGVHLWSLLEKQMESDDPSVILNLEEGALVAVHVERFTITRAKRGGAPFNCPLYLRVWILRQPEQSGATISHRNCS